MIRSMIIPTKPPDYRPPQSAAELLERYAAGERYFVGAKLNGGMLHGANLSGADLSYAEFKGAGLQGADFDHAVLRDADMEGVDCVLAKFRYTDFSRTKLSGGFPDAYFYGTTLRSSKVGTLWALNAEFRFVEFIGCSPTKFYVRGATFNSCKFLNCDLRNIEGAKDASYEWPCTVDVCTLEVTAGKLEDVDPRSENTSAFLDGIGVSSRLISAYPQLVPSTTTRYSCFISYSHADSDFVVRLHAALTSNGVKCWLDKHEVYPGDDIYEEVSRGVSNSDKVLLVCSKHSLTSWWVDNEIDEVFEKERTLMKEISRKTLALIPLVLDNDLLDHWESGKARQVRSRLAADFRGWHENASLFDQKIEHILQALDPNRRM